MSHFKSKEAKPDKEKDVSPPLNVAVGWLEGVSKKDAAIYAKEFVDRWFTAKEISFYNIAPFEGGYFYEVQEGGSGQSYLPAIVDALQAMQDKENERVWFPSGSRAFMVSYHDGLPLGMLLSEQESEELRTTELPPLTPKGKMKPVVKKGYGMFVVGGTFFAASLMSLLATGFMYAAIPAPEPLNNQVSLDMLPHRQWHLLQVSSPTTYVDALRFSNGSWSVSWRDFRDSDRILLEEMEADEQVFDEDLETLDSDNGHPQTEYLNEEEVLP